MKEGYITVATNKQKYFFSYKYMERERRTVNNSIHFRV